ncbi:MAG TPA: DUF4202 family protein [Thermoanaerobaculia bacterium]|jgi:hypothetical protein
MLVTEFPSVFVRFADDGAPHLRASEWDRPDFDTWDFDCRIDELAADAFTLRLVDDAAHPSFAVEVMNRCQRHVGRRNRHSQGQLFTRVLRRHRALHDLEKPLVRADYNHALDVWQWLLRLEPDAPVHVQFAGLFHDIERLSSEPDVRVEHLAPDYQAFKDAHARGGVELTDRVLAEAGVSAEVRGRVVALVAAHERASGDSEVALLNDADALSFFSLNSNGYANYFGREQTKKKVAYTLNRLRPAARAKLATVRLRPDVRAMVE